MNCDKSLESFFKGEDFPQGILNKKITFFAGSFNPLHKGHLACIELWKKKTTKDHSLIVIADLNPWKKNELSPEENRKEIISTLKEKLPTDTLLFDKFLFQDKSNPTIDWIDIIDQAFPRLELSLLIGFDSFLNIGNWKQSSKLLNILNSLYIANRNNNELSQSLKTQEYLAINPELKLIFLGEHQYEDLSSTKLRSIG